MKIQKKKKVIFLDRDGTINKEKNYLYRIQDLELIEGVIEAIKLFHEMGFLLIVLTNQSGVGRGFYQEKDVLKLHSYLNKKIRNEISFMFGENIENPIDSFYYCPHYKDSDIEKYRKKCNCRKPDIGMLQSATIDYLEKGFELDIKNSIIIGDKESDITFGCLAEIGTKVLVRSGQYEGDISNTKADLVFDDLLDFAYYLYKQISSN